MLGRILRILVVSLVAASTLSVSPGAAASGPPQKWTVLGQDPDPTRPSILPGNDIADQAIVDPAIGGTSDPRVSLSDDGNRVAIASPNAIVTASGRRTGIVRVYDLTPGSTWKQVSANLFAENSGQTFGESISLSGDGSLLAVSQKSTTVVGGSLADLIKIRDDKAAAAKAAKGLADARDTLLEDLRGRVNNDPAVVNARKAALKADALRDAAVGSAFAAETASAAVNASADVTTAENAAKETLGVVGAVTAAETAAGAVTDAKTAAKTAADEVKSRLAAYPRSVELFDLSETGTATRRSPISNAFDETKTEKGLAAVSGFGKSVSLSDDGSRIAVSSDNNIRVYDLTDGPTTLLGLITTPVANGLDTVTNTFPRGSGAVLSGDGLRVAFVPGAQTPSNRVLEAHQVEVYHLTNDADPVWNRVASFTASRHVRLATLGSLALDKDGSTLVVRSSDDTVQVYDQGVHAWNQRGDLGVAGSKSVSVSDDGLRVAIGKGPLLKVQVSEWAKNSWKRHQFITDVPGENVSLSANGRTLAIAHSVGTVRVQALNRPPVFNTVTVTQSKTGLPLATASDEDGDTITYILDTAAQAVFDIDAATGQVTFKTAPIYDPTDASKNSHKFTVTASDGQLTTDSEEIRIVVTETAVFRSPANPACAEGAQPPHGFTDVAGGSYAHADITCIKALGVTNGTSATTYSPADNVTREQMAAFLGRLYRNVTGKECAATDHGFGDVPSTSYANGDVGCLKNLKVVTAAEGFRPSDDLTRLEAGQMMARLYREISGEDDCSADAHGFTDVASVTDEDAQEDIRCIKATGITTGTSATAYSPGKTMTREMMAAFLARLYRLVIV